MTDKPKDYPTIEFCPDCKNHCEFEFNEEAERWQSHCCGAEPKTLKEKEDDN